ncbi:hypothetical protein P7K49_014898, partial [Saguinus oedipus]
MATEIPGNTDPQSHGAATTYDHGNSREPQTLSHMVQPPPMAMEILGNGDPSRMVQPVCSRGNPGNADASHMLQPPPTAMEIPGNTDPQSHGTATTYSQRNSGEHRLSCM